MIDPDLKVELERIERKVDEALNAANRARRWIQWTVIISAILILLPLVFLPFAIGSYVSSYEAALEF